VSRIKDFALGQRVMVLDVYRDSGLILALRAPGAVVRLRRQDPGAWIALDARLTGEFEALHPFPADDEGGRGTHVLAYPLCKSFDITLPSASELQFGGIIGSAHITGIVPPGDSGLRWHFPEQYGFTLTEQRTIPFISCRGYQGFWRPPAELIEQLARAA
jgi:hypothetical protein